MPVYNVARGHTGIDFVNDTIKACLMKTTWTPEVDDDTLDIALASGECAATDYQRITLANKSVVFNDTTDSADHLADDIAFYTNSDDGTVGKVLIYKEVTDDTDSIPIAALNMAVSRSTGTDTTITTTFPNGIVYSGRNI